MKKLRKNAHIVLCAALGRGHLTPMLALAQALASTGEFSITIILSSKGGRDSIQDDRLFTGLDIEFSVLDDSDPNEDPAWMARTAFPVRMKGLPRLDTSESHLPVNFPSYEVAFDRFLTDLPSPPRCIINDFTNTWAAAPARASNIPRYVLYTDPATFMALAYHAETLVKRGDLPVKHPSQKLIVPGIIPLLEQDISRLVWDTEEPYFPMQKMWHQQILESDGALLNTFYELESSAVDAIRGVILPGATLYTVGPLISSALAGGDSRSTAFASPPNGCIQWLDSNPEYSVLYISFGSWEMLSGEQVVELAKGLESSGCRFLWVMNGVSESDIESILPDGFRERVIQSGRGLIFSGWAPQQEILSHPSVAGFLMQCGWNSVLECVCLAGVPIICWPFAGDQPTTSRFLIDGLGIAVDVCEDEKGLVGKTEVENAVREVMSGARAEEMRAAARELKKLAKASMDTEHGSSWLSLRAFIKHVLAGKSL